MRLVITIALFLLPIVATAHSAEDPAAKLVKKRHNFQQYQQDYKDATSREEKLRSLKRQITNLQSAVLLMRNSLVKESPSIRANMSKHGIDYVRVMSNSLKDMQKTLKQLKAITKE